MASIRKREWTHKGETKTAWILDYVDNGGARRQKTFERKKDAEAARIQVGSELSRGLHVADRATVDVARAARDYLIHVAKRHHAGEIGLNTARHYRSVIDNRILPSLGGEKLTRLTPPRLQSWFDGLAYDPVNPVSPASMVYIRIVMTELLSFAVLRGLVSVNHMKTAAIETPRYAAPKAEFLDRNIIRTVLNASAGQLRMALHTMAFTGLRGGELRALRWDDIDFAGGEIRVRRAAEQFGRVKGPKTKAGNRDIPLAPRLARMLKEWKLSTSFIPCPPRADVRQRWEQIVASSGVTDFGAAFPRRSLSALVELLASLEIGEKAVDAVKLAGMSWPTYRDWKAADPIVDRLVQNAMEMNRRHSNRDNLCFINEDGAMLYQNRLQTVDLKGLLKDKQMDRRQSNGRLDIHLHLLRHVAASLFIEQGLGPKRIQNIMGHASIKTTFDTYGHLFEDREALRRAVDEIEAALLGTDGGDKVATTASN